MTDQKTAELIKRIKKGDDGAFATLLAQFEPLVVATAARFCKPPAYVADDFEDLRQEAVLALFKAAESFDEGYTAVSFGLYAKICIKNRLISAKRQRMRALKKEGRGVGRPRKHPKKEQAQQGAAKERAFLGDGQLHLLVEQAEHRFSAKEKRVFDLYLSGKSYKEMAETLQCSEKAVDNALSRAKRKIKMQMPGRDRSKPL